MLFLNYTFVNAGEKAEVSDGNTWPVRFDGIKNESLAMARNDYLVSDVVVMENGVLNGN